MLKKIKTAEQRAKEATRMRIWRAANPDKVKTIAAKWRSKKENAEKNRVQAAAWRAANPAKEKAAKARYYVENKECVNAAKSKWYAENKDKSRETNRLWLKNNPDKARARSAKWRAKNLERCRAMTLAWTKANQEQFKANIKAWKCANKERVRKTNAAWHAANPEKALIKKYLRRMREAKSGGRIRKGDIAFLMERQSGVCASLWCNESVREQRHVDHIMPLKLGGSNERDNLQILCPVCNLSKGSKHPADFLAEHGITEVMVREFRQC